MFKVESIPGEAYSIVIKKPDSGEPKTAYLHQFQWLLAQWCWGNTRHAYRKIGVKMTQNLKDHFWQIPADFQLLLMLSCSWYSFPFARWSSFHRSTGNTQINSALSSKNQENSGDTLLTLLNGRVDDLNIQLLATAWMHWQALLIIHLFYTRVKNNRGKGIKTQDVFRYRCWKCSRAMGDWLTMVQEHNWISWWTTIITVHEISWKIIWYPDRWSV